MLPEAHGMRATSTYPRRKRSCAISSMETGSLKRNSARPCDIFLPDCFGFGYALPSIASHMGLIGFSTQKLSWGSAYGIPFDIGRWYGVDGSYLISALNPGSYSSSISSLVSSDSTWVNRVNSNGSNYGVYTAYKYYGTGDTGGSPTSGSVNYVQQDLNQGVNPTTGVQVFSATSDQLFRDIAAAGLADKLPSFNNELLMTTHGAGSYTSRAASKRFNRQNELLADATERASVMADWLGGAPYPNQQFWIRPGSALSGINSMTTLPGPVCLPHI